MPTRTGSASLGAQWVLAKDLKTMLASGPPQGLLLEREKFLQASQVVFSGINSLLAEQ